MLTRDQQRAVHAYSAVGDIGPDKALRQDYEIRVKNLGAQVIRGGLTATMSFLERDRDKPAVTLLLGHLANARIPGLEGCPGQGVPARIRAMDVDAYMLATREFLRVVLWLRRAVQAAAWDQPTAGQGRPR